MMSKEDIDRKHSFNMTGLCIGWFGKELIGAAFFVAMLAIVVGPVHAEANPGGAGKSLDKVVLQLTWYHEFQFAGYYAAQLNGFYSEEGLEVEIRDRLSNQLPVDAVLSGEADFGNATSDVVLLRMQGKPVVVLACIMQHSPWAILVRADSGITTLEDLIGKTVSMDMNYRDVELLAMFRDEHISTEKMTIVKKGSGVENLINGTVDARASYLSDQPFALQEKGFEPRVIRPINYGIDFYGDTLFTSERQIREHPERVAAFRRASLRGWQYAMEHPEELIDHILSTYYADPKPGDVSYSREHLAFEAKVLAEDLMHPVLVEIGHMNPNRWRRIADTYADMGMAEAMDSLDEFIYDPDPAQDYRLLYVAVGLFAGLLFVGTLARIWNKGLRKAVLQRTRELEESKERLKESEKQSRAWLEHSPVCTKKVNLDFNLQYMSRAGLESLNIKDTSEIYGKPYPFDFYPELFRNTMTANLKKVRETGEVIEQEAPVVDVDGNELWFHSTLVPVNDDHGQIDYIIVISAETTERKKAENEILAKSEQLQASNQQLAASEQQLQASNQQLRANELERENLLKTLTAKNKELQSIVYIASHDLKSPLVNIQGFSARLNENCQEMIAILKGFDVSEDILQQIVPLTEEDIPEALRFITASANKMKVLLDGLLHVSRVGTVDLNIKALHMNDIVTNVLGFMEFQIKEAEAEVSIDDLPGCIGDEEMVNQVFSNLVGNALKYLDPDRKGKFHISGTVVNSHCHYCVEDNGIGIADEHQPKIFELFHRLNPKDSAGGEGLGLTIVSRILERNNGTIRVESEPGKGSKFFVSLPTG